MPTTRPRIPAQWPRGQCPSLDMQSPQCLQPGLPYLQASPGHQRGRAGAPGRGGGQRRRASHQEPPTSRQCRSGQRGPRDLAKGGGKWETSPSASPACPHPGRDPLVPTHVIFTRWAWLARDCGSLGKGQRGAHHGAILKGRYQPCSQEPLQTSWAVRDIPAPTLSPACLLMSQHGDLLPHRYHHQVRGINASPGGHRDGKNRGQGTAHSHPPCHPEGPPGCKDPCAGHRHPPTRCKNSLALAGKL